MPVCTLFERSVEDGVKRYRSLGRVSLADTPNTDQDLRLPGMAGTFVVLRVRQAVVQLGGYGDDEQDPPELRVLVQAAHTTDDWDLP